MSSLKALIDHYRRADGTEVKTYIHLNADGEDKHRIATEFDSTFLHEQLKIFSSQEKCEADGMRLERVVPMHVLDRAMHEGWLHDDKKWREWANSPEGRNWAIEHKGRINKL